MKRRGHITLLAVILATLLCLSACDSDAIEYYDPSLDTTAAETEAVVTEPTYDDLLVGSTCSALPLTAMLRTAKSEITYTEAEMYTDVGTVPEVLSAITNGNIELALMPYDTQADTHGLKVTPIAKQALIFFVSSSNPIKELTSEQIKSIYGGTYISWEELNGAKVEINAIQRGPSTAAQEYLEIFTGGVLADPPISVATGRADVFDHASESDIGFVVYTPEILTSANDVRILAVDGVLPSEETIADGSYPLVFNICALCSPTNEAALEIAEWLTSEEGQSIAAFSGYTPLDSGYEGYKYSIQLYSSPGTGSESHTENDAQFYYTLSEDIVSIDENGKYKINGLVNQELAADINTFIDESVTQLSEYNEIFDTFIGLREAEGGLIVETECINGYLSVIVRLRYAGDICEHSYKYRCRTYNLYTGEILELSDLFYKDIDFAPDLHRSIAEQAATPYDSWNSVKLLKRELSGLPNSFGFSLSGIYFDIDNPFFCNGEIFTLDDLSEMMLIWLPRTMDGIWEDGYVTRSFRTYGAYDGCEPIALYDTTVLDGMETVESLVYFHLSASRLGLDGQVCDNINNAMYAYLKNEASPTAIEAKITATGASVTDFYYVNMKWRPTFYGNSFVCFTTDGTVEYVDNKYEYHSFDGFYDDLYFSLESGEYLTPDHVFTEGWESEAQWYGYPSEGAPELLENGLDDLVPEPEDGDKKTSSKDKDKTDEDEEPEEDAALTSVTADTGYPLHVTGLEITADENGWEVLTVRMTERAEHIPEGKYAFVTVSVPTSYIDWN